METTRRKFLITASLAGAALMLRCRKGDSPPAARSDAFRASTWIKLHPDGRVEFLLPKIEMGQGIATALAVIVADELCIDLDRIDARIPATNEVGGAFRVLDTGSTKSVRLMWPMLRKTAATAREMLVGAAAERWQVAPRECHVESGVVVHPASGRRAPYGELLADARRRPRPKRPRWLPADRLRLIGRPHRRIEGPEIVSGRTRYGCDVRLPGLQFAVLARPPSPGAKLLSFDKEAALAEPGVVAVEPIGDAVAVVGETSWDAMRGRRALGAKWSASEAESFSSETFEASTRAAFEAPRTAKYDPKAREMAAVEVVSSGEPLASPRADAKVLEAEYATAFQAHAPSKRRTLPSGSATDSARSGAEPRRRATSSRSSGAGASRKSGASSSIPTGSAADSGARRRSTSPRRRTGSPMPSAAARCSCSGRAKTTWPTTAFTLPLATACRPSSTPRACGAGGIASRRRRRRSSGPSGRRAALA